GRARRASFMPRGMELALRAETRALGRNSGRSDGEETRGPRGAGPGAEELARRVGAGRRHGGAAGDGRGRRALSFQRAYFLAWRNDPQRRDGTALRPRHLDTRRGVTASVRLGARARFRSKARAGAAALWAAAALAFAAGEDVTDEDIGTFAKI